MGRPRFSPDARTDLDEILFQIAVADYRPQVAQRVYDAIHATCDLYAQNPTLGEARPDLGEGIRICRQQRWVIFSQIAKDGIEVLRILDGARDYPSLFR